MNKYNSGYIVFPRWLLSDSWRYYRNSKIKSVFIECVKQASWKDYYIEEFHGKPIKPILIKRGSFLTSYRKMAELTGLNIGEIRHAFMKLSTPNLQHSDTTQFVTQEIRLTTTHLYTVVTINDYAMFQSSYDDLQHSEKENSNTVNNTQLQQQMNNIYTNKDKKIKRYKDISAGAHSESLNSLTLKLLKNNFIDNNDVPEMYNQLFAELSDEYDMQHINVVLDYILGKMKDKNIKNKYFYLKKSLEVNLKKMKEIMEADNTSEEKIPVVTANKEELDELLQQLKGGKL